MTVTKVTPLYGSLAGTGHLAGVREYTKVFSVVTDTYTDGVIAVGNAFGIPHKGDVYFWQGETDAGALCVSVNPVRNTDSELWWTVTCEFSSDRRGGPEGAMSQDPRYDNTNPFSNPPTVTWDHWEEEENIEEDRHGNAILTPAGKPYVPPLRRIVKHSRVVVVRNEPSYPTVLDQGMRGKLNRDVFFGWQPRQAKFEDVSGTSQFSQGMVFWQIRYEILFKKPDFDLDVQRKGTTVIKLLNPPFGSGEVEVLPVDEETGVPHTNPVMLNTDGTQMSKVDVAAARLLPKRDPGSLYEKWEVDEDTPFAALNF
jgi:hypothetical protein